MAAAEPPKQPMPDPIFANPRLAAIYDALDGDRADLDYYVAMVEEFSARSVLDIGCGTGTFACRLASVGLTVIGVDPARASLDIAARKPWAERVHWIHGTVANLPPLTVDVAMMTANVAQVFVDDDEWVATLTGTHDALRVGGHLVFETRNPIRRGWEAWTRERSRTVTDIVGLGAVESWVELLDVALPIVSFRWTYRFAADGAVITSDSTLRFRSRDEVEATVRAAGFRVIAVRDAPDRPGCELVFVAVRP
jgi:SAM-dependent methyltransferase